ncbi:MAG: S41 family peptidase [Cytophagales bacterium]|nr:S41 family peptidase [Cytophagales bacterium]
MKNVKMMIGLLTLFVLSGQLMAQPLIMQPSISPDGQLIAFSYQGDLWTVGVNGGRASRLTIHEGYDGNPRWSNDGNQIYFQSDRFGNNDIFLMSAGGGIPTRLTFHSGNDDLMSIQENGNALFGTRRIYAQVERSREIYEVSASGGTPTRYMDAMGFDAVVSPDGSKVAFVRGTCRIAREAYRGPANRDVWVWDRNADSYQQLTTFDGNDFSPLWLNDNELLFLSARSGRYNVHRANLSGEISQLTQLSDNGINSISLSTTAQKVIYQAMDQVAAYDLSSGQTQSISIQVASDARYDQVSDKTISNRVSEFAISPNGKYMAYVHRGEIFLTRNDKEDSRSVRITNNPANDRSVKWLNDEKLIFTSDRNGQYDLFMAESSDEEEKDLFKTFRRTVKQIDKTSEEEFAPILSPDKSKLAYRQGRGKLIVADISEEGKLSNKKTLVEGWATPNGVAWSPDSKWLAYGLSDLYFNQEIYIHKADDSEEPINVSMHPKGDGNPVWSPDGSKLGFISSRNNGDQDVWFAWLKKSDWEKARENWKREEKEGSDDKKKDEESEVVIEIDPKIYQRLEQVTAYSGNEGDMVFDKSGNWIYYSLNGSGRTNASVERNLYKIKWDGTKKKEVYGGGKSPRRIRLDEKQESVLFLTTGGKVVTMKTKDDKASNLTVSSKISIDHVAEREQIFEEAWRGLNAGFYDPNFHGQDWEALKKKYKPVALKASTTEDFGYFYNNLLGQLNSSHMGLRSNNELKETQRERTGQLGIEGKNVKKGFEVTRVLSGSPADKEESKLNVGDVIQTINQEPVTASTNVYELLKASSDNPVLLEVDRNKKVEDVVIWPVRSLNSELYDDWVEERRRLTDQYSNGRLGYLHIRGMNWTSFERFERELTAAGQGKEGIVIDVRYNGGGWTTDYLMAVLNVEQHAYTVPRGAAKDLQAENKNFAETYPFSERLPLASWTKPSVALCNESSYSNAEIFSHAYKHLGIGKLVGKATFGAVISTGGMGLIDGSFVRMPFRAWYVKATGENMEHGPAVPHIELENPPAYKAKKEDPQLQKAVETLLGDL